MLSKESGVFQKRKAGPAGPEHVRPNEPLTADTVTNKAAQARTLKVFDKALRPMLCFIVDRVVGSIQPCLVGCRPPAENQQKASLMSAPEAGFCITAVVAL